MEKNTENIMSGKRKCELSRKPTKHALSRSRRAELQLPVSRVDHLLRTDHCFERLSWATPVFLTGILEYLTSKILELAGKEACNDKKKLITSEHVQRAVDDNHLSHLFEDVTSPQVDGMPSLRK